MMETVVGGIELDSPEAVTAVTDDDGGGLPIFLRIYGEAAMNKRVQIDQLSTMRDDADILAKVIRRFDALASPSEELWQALFDRENLRD